MTRLTAFALALLFSAATLTGSLAGLPCLG